MTTVQDRTQAPATAAAPWVLMTGVAVVGAQSLLLAPVLPLLRPPRRLGLDLVHLRWSPGLPAAAAAAAVPADGAEVVLTGADTAAAIGWGWERGVALFEGRLLRPRG